MANLANDSIGVLEAEPPADVLVLGEARASEDGAARVEGYFEISFNSRIAWVQASDVTLSIA